MNNQPIPSPYVKKNEMDVLKKFFKDNDELLLAMRAVMLDLEPTDQQIDLVRSTFADEQLFKAVEYRFLPQLSKEVPIGQVQDIWLGIDQQILGANPQTIEQMVSHNQQSIWLMQGALQCLKSNTGSVVVDKWPTIKDDPLQIGLLARNRFIRAVETQLMTLKTLANQKEQSVENSTKNSSR
jgi:hypothetical protein